MEKKKKHLYDLIGICCGVVVLVTGIVSGILAPKPVAVADDGPAAGTVLAVAEAEHTGKGVAKKVDTMSGATVLHAADWEKDYPEIYNSFMQNQENDEVTDYLK